MDNQLDDLNRSKLDGIVQQAINNGEDENTIHRIVDDYKSKYGTPPLRFKTEGAQGSTPARAVQFNENPNSDVFREFIGRHIPSLLATAGSYAGPIGGAAGSAAGEGLRTGFPNQFGGPESGSIFGDLLGNSILPGAINAVTAPRATAAQIAAAAYKLKSPAITQLMDATSAVGDETRQAYNTTMEDSSKRYLDAAKQAELNYREKIFGKGDPKVKDPNVATPSGFKLPDPTTFSPRSSDLPSSYDPIDKTLPNLDYVKTILKKVQQTDPIMNPVMRYAKNRLIFALPTALFGGIAPAAAVGTTIVLGEEALRQLVKDPETAQMVIKAINTPLDSKEASVIGPAVYNAIRGTVVTLKSPDGEMKKATIGQDGRLVYQKE
jgi:hypothetical protein